MFRIEKLKIVATYKLWLRFSDGAEGIVDLSHLVGKGIFSQWLKPGNFDQVSIGESGELRWGDSIDLCPAK